MTNRMCRNCLITLLLLNYTATVWAQADGAAKIKPTVIPQFNPAGPGQKMALAIQLNIPAGGHLYANPRQGDMGIDTEVTATAPGVRFGKPVYPAGKDYLDKALNEKNHIYEGLTVIYLPLEIPAATKDSLVIELAFSGLYCTDTGSCIPWESSLRYTQPVGPAAQATASPLFDGFDLAAVQWQEPPAGAPASGDDTPAAPAGPQVAIPDYQPIEFSGMTMNWFKAILLALIAGAILNIMPCVLPVIPLKVLSIIQQAQNDREAGDPYKSIKLALVFSLGILLVFGALAAVMSGFKLFYGQQFQNDLFKFIMLWIIFVLTLSMMGLFEIVLPGRLTNIGVVKQGYAGALGMGIMATLLATPCSAPLLGPVLVWSLSRPTPVTIGVFLMVGVGMAAPYVILTAFPNLLHRVPKAGTWMIRLKEGLSFVMLGVCAYLIYLFPPAWMMPLLVYCIILAFACWLAFKAVDYSTPTGRKTVIRLIALLIIALTTWQFWQRQPAPSASGKTVETARTADNWLVAELVPRHQAEQTVMVEFTADWCPNCKAVELTVLNRDEFKAKLQQTGTHLIIADLTQNDPALKELLTRLGSQSIPFTAIFPGGDPLRPIVLRDVYSLGSALKALDMAAAK